MATSATVYEVGPLARMVNTYVRPATQISVNDSDTSATVGDFGITAHQGGAYTVSGLVSAALGLVTTAQLQLFTARSEDTLQGHWKPSLSATQWQWPGGWVDSLVPDQSCYTYKRIPKQISTGFGLTEAPRGALGHWIKIEGRKVAKYQCVVPSTWNFSPSTDGGTTPGPVEQSLIGSTIGSDATSQVINILRLVHPFDCCIACAVHVVTPEGKEKLKFAIGPDGKPSNIEVKE